MAKTATKKDDKPVSAYSDPKSKVAKGLVRVEKAGRCLDINPASLREHQALGWAQIDAESDED